MQQYEFRTTSLSLDNQLRRNVSKFLIEFNLQNISDFHKFILDLLFGTIMYLEKSLTREDVDFNAISLERWFLYLSKERVDHFKAKVKEPSAKNITQYHSSYTDYIKFIAQRFSTLFIIPEVFNEASPRHYASTEEDVAIRERKFWNIIKMLLLHPDSSHFYERTACILKQLISQLNEDLVMPQEAVDYMYERTSMLEDQALFVDLSIDPNFDDDYNEDNLFGDLEA